MPTVVPLLIDARLMACEAGEAEHPVDARRRRGQIRIPSVLVIPGNVGYLKQFFSAQLFVANGAPARLGLTVRDVTGTIELPAGADHVGRHVPTIRWRCAETARRHPAADDAVRGVGPDGRRAPPTTWRARPRRAGAGRVPDPRRAEGFHTLDFDIAAVLDGLPTGPVTVTGKATGGVLVRNPYFDMTFTVPAVGARRRDVQAVRHRHEHRPGHGERRHRDARLAAA